MGFLDPDRYDDLAKQLGATVARDRKRPALVKNGVSVEFEERFGDPAAASLRTSHIRFRAELPSPGVPKFRLYPEGFQSFMSKLFGGQDVELGHRGVDLKFMVKALSPAIVQQLWTPALCERLDTMGALWIEGEDQRIELQQQFETMDLLMDPVPGIELLFALCDVDLYGRDVLRALPDAQIRPELGEVWLPGPSDVRFGFIRTHERVSINARMAIEQPIELTDDIKRQFDQVGALVELALPDLLLVWGERACSAERFLRGAELLRQLVDTVPGDGIFR